MYRSHTCGELRIDDKDKQVTLAGWVQKVRKFGSITFVDIRDRYGITQILFNEKFNDRLDDSPIGREFVIQVSGKVLERSNKNPKLPTGDIEIEVSEFKVLNKSSVPPFTIEEDTDGGDELLMKYRYLDLRRAPLQRNMMLRHQINRAARSYLDNSGFIEIETPFLIKSTPEGARDFIVPSGMNKHQFYALPQSPQTFKQLLMMSGYDKYYQIVKCFRDEDLRADRQPEFTQIDCEMSFVDQEDIISTFEGLIKNIFKEVKGIDITTPLERLSWDEAMWKYGNDKPDIRFGMTINNCKVNNEVHTDALKGLDFKVLNDAESILAITVKGGGEYSRKDIDELTNWVKRPQIGMSGMIYVKCNEDGTYKSSIDKFLNDDKKAELAQFCSADKGDIILILAGKETLTRKAISELRLEMGKRLGFRKPDEYKLLWVVDFPLFEYAEDDDRWVARHHPFTAPKPEHTDWLDKPEKYGEIKANAYDMVLNGNEIGGGSIRIFQRDMQEKMFKALGMDENEAKERFGFLLNAFEYGAPPHGGIAFGFDRLCALLGGTESIRDFIAFPKNNAGRDVMLDAPSYVDNEQLEYLNIELSKENND